MTSTTRPRFELTPRIAAWRGGAGPHVVLLHGVGLNADAWSWMADGLMQKFTVTALDMPGHGASAVIEGNAPATLESYSNAVADALKTFSAPLVLVGHSMGALIAMDIAIRMPRLLSGCVALNAIFRRTREAADAVQARATELRDGATMDNSATLTRWFGDAPSGLMKEASEACDRMLKACDRAAYARAYEIFAHEDGPKDEDLARCPVPMLFITGAGEPNSTPAMSEALAWKAAYGQCHIVAGARHMMPITHADTVNRHIGTFMDTTSRPIGRK